MHVPSLDLLTAHQTSLTRQPVNSPSIVYISQIYLKFSVFLMPVIRVEGFQVPQTQVPQSFETHQAYTDTTKF